MNQKTELFAFVLMPFSSEFADIYNFGIKKTAQEQGFRAERVDEQRFTETMLARIYSQIECADVIVADMTGRNANVFYEVGYAHAKGKLVVLLTQDASDIPFDMKHHRHLIYGGSIEDLSRRLQEELEWCRAEIERRESDSYEIRLKRTFGTLTTNSYRDVGEAEIELELENLTGKRGPEIDTISICTSDGWVLKHRGVELEQVQLEDSEYDIQHLLAPPTKRLGKNQRIPIKFIATKTLWTSFEDPPRLKEYRIAGVIEVSVLAEDEEIKKELHLDVTFDEIPF